MAAATPRPIVFLDIDGVLNTERSMVDGAREHDRNTLDPVACGHLARLLRETNAVVVLSSTWRLNHSLADMGRILAKYGCPGVEFVGVTPYGVLRRGEDTYRRGHEIQWWLDAVGTTAPFVILDDDSDMEHLLPRLVQTDTFEGLTAVDVDRAVELLRSWGVAEPPDRDTPVDWAASVAALRALPAAALEPADDPDDEGEL